MTLSQLIYVSTKKALPSGEIFAIQHQAKRNNARDELTGVLLFDRAHFLQCLEGERERVTRRFAAIAADDRHGQVSLLHTGDIEQRGYPDWSMGLLDAASPAVRAALADVLPGGLLTPETLTTDSSRLMMQRVRSLHLTR